MAPKLKRKPSAGQRLEPLAPPPRSNSRKGPDFSGSSRGPHPSRADIPLPPKPNSAGVGTGGGGHSRSHSHARNGTSSKPTHRDHMRDDYSIHSMDSASTSNSKKTRSGHHGGGGEHQNRQPSAHKDGKSHRKNEEPGSALFTLLDHMKEKGVGLPTSSSGGPSKPSKIRREKGGGDHPHRRSDDRTAPADTLGYRGASEPLPSPKLEESVRGSGGGGRSHHEGNDSTTSSHHHHHHRSSSKRRKEGGGDGVEDDAASVTSSHISSHLNHSNIRLEAHNRSKALAEGMPSSTRGKLNLTPTKADSTSVMTTNRSPGSPGPSSSTAPGKKQPLLSEPSRATAGSVLSHSPLSSAAAAAAANPRNGGPARSKSQTSRSQGPTSDTVTESAPQPKHKSSSKSSSSSTKRPTEPLKDAPSGQNYRDKNTWNKNLSKSVLDVLNGRTLEDPFTTHLWKQAYRHPEDEEDQHDRYDNNCDGQECNPHIHQYQSKNRDGYYACIRCKAPICSPKYQVINEERGIAAFQHLNAEALDIEIDVTGNAVRGKKVLRMDPEEACNIHFLAFCASCHGCLGVCTMEVPSSMTTAVTSGELFYANSCCLVYQRYRTTANLKGVIVGIDGLERDQEQGLLDDDDLDELQSNDDFGLNINDFDSDDGEGARRPLIEFPSEEDEGY